MSSESFDRAAELFSVLATPLRLRIMHALGDGELSVMALVVRIDASQPNMSRHLQVLYQARLVTKRRCGHRVLYRIADEPVSKLCQAVCGAMSDEQQAAQAAR